MMFEFLSLAAWLGVFVVLGTVGLFTIAEMGKHGA